MSRPSWLQKVYWNYFGKPVQERALFRVLLDRPVSSILEIGVGDGARMRRIAKLARIAGSTDAVRYIGTDEFESAEDRSRHMTLKNAYQLASQLGFKKASLIPGSPLTALPRVAHKLGISEVVIIDGGLDPLDPLSGVVGGWLNRLAHADSAVLACRQPGEELVLVDSQLLNLPIRIAA